MVVLTPHCNQEVSVCACARLCAYLADGLVFLHSLFLWHHGTASQEKHIVRHEVVHTQIDWYSTEPN